MVNMRSSIYLALLSTVCHIATASPLHSRQQDQCPPGQVFYACASGQKGCFTYDPCTLPSTVIPTTDNKVIQSATAVPPITTPVPTSEPACASGLVTSPKMHNIYIYPGITPFPARANIFNIYNKPKNVIQPSEQQQVAVFRGIPASAKKCKIGAQIAAERSFSVFDNGLMNITQLTGLPQGDITVDTIRRLDSTTFVDKQINFQFWPELPGARVLNMHDVECASELYFRFEMSDEFVPGNGGPGSITLEQDANNGFFVQYEC